MVKHGDNLIMIWDSMIVFFRLSFFHKIERSMYQYYYKHILEECMYYIIQIYNLDPHNLMF